MNIYVGFWKRAEALALDYTLILIYLIALILIGFLINSPTGVVSWLFAERVRAQLSGFLLVTLPSLLYLALRESSRQRDTCGKKKVSLQATDHNGGQISRWRSLARTTTKFIPWEISHTHIWAVTFSAVKNSTWINYTIGLISRLIGLNLLLLLFTRKH